MDLISIVGSIFTLVTYIRFRKQLTAKAYQLSVIITMILCPINALIYLSASCSFTYTSNETLCSSLGAVTMFTEIYAYLWSGYMCLLSFLLIIEHRPKCHRFASKNGLYKLWLISYNVVTVCVLVPIILLFYFKGYFNVTGDWCWAIDEGKSDSLSIFVGIVTIPLFEFIAVFMIVIFGAMSYKVYHKKITVNLERMSCLLETNPLDDAFTKNEFKRTERTIVSSTWRMGISCLIFVLIDLFSILSRLVWGGEYRWPYIYNDFVAWLWGCMPFLLAVSYVKNIWLMWFRE